MDDPRDRWPALLADQTQIRDRLIEAYDEPDRGYHDLLHLTEVLGRIDEILWAEGDQIGQADNDRVDGDGVLLAAWFHDAVYESASDDEERSALLAERELAAVDAPANLIREVVRLVRLTATHCPDEGDLAGQVLCDADLAILAADEDRYRQYAAGVRKEYAHVSDEVFRAGRAAILRDLVAKPSLFHTSFAKQHWESAARASVARELRELQG